MRRASMDDHLFNRRGIIHFDLFARHVGIAPTAFEKMLDKDLFPEPGPNRLIGGSWFINANMEAAWWRWLRKEASDDQIEEIARILAEDDVSYEIQDHYPVKGEKLRDWVIDVTEINTSSRWRRHFCPKYAPRSISLVELLKSPV